MPRRRAVASAREQDETERRHPLRFVWQMDADGRFVVGSDEFVELMVRAPPRHSGGCGARSPPN